MADSDYGFEESPIEASSMAGLVSSFQFVLKSMHCVVGVVGLFSSFMVVGFLVVGFPNWVWFF